VDLAWPLVLGVAAGDGGGGFVAYRSPCLLDRAEGEGVGCAGAAHPDGYPAGFEGVGEDGGPAAGDGEGECDIEELAVGVGTACIEVVPREGNANGARVKMMRPRRVHVSADLERLFADYLTHLACRAASRGLEITPASPLLVNLDRPPLLAAMREGTVRDKVTALKKKGIGPPGWTPHWFRHSHASAL
jgi:hypothetical protein